VAAPRDLAIDHGAHEHSLVRYALAVLALLERYRQPEPWWAEALCRGDGCTAWFPEDRQGPSRGLRETCAACPVQAECAEAGQSAFAGVWAGQRIRFSNRTPLAGVTDRGPDPSRAALTGSPLRLCHRALDHCQSVASPADDSTRE
jgi:hypothetical protein